ncbi:MAG: general secretion pathway protein GspB [Candidatus Thiodiazotropha sp. (ex Lucinoma borealis)]|nr:general secretion pathway protein GspB [Candidatus Thiodiazotropha sp. (ex Lucinoma borealis)]MCU7838178.1 general secretion pathway protein GspB [Candidatus Thiodiazotropha sp. (ex Troendleina suluensis)]MCU7945161.1 general secretion pathway protein GspB [Candidatus Thiodiazotropha sp. (ex Cardiolucina cf. quadrata)]MCU7856380.1 general secretion pathway protein GspB [Candidatus Thiodiazotropha sp. (ex Lucinoma borealis)]MCU7863762.1 general secretion pathway protein GspB [Candidatus Thiod
MSLILEALKKAERQHKLGEVPSISADMEQTPATTSGRLGWVMLALFFIVILGIGIYLGSNSWLAQQGETTESSMAPPVQQKPQQKEISSTKEVVRAPELPDTTQLQSVTKEQLANAPVATLPKVEPKQAIAPEPPPQPPKPPKPPKPLHEMPSGFVSHLPSMNIDIHSYDKRPNKRYVLINMEKYREGDYLAEGPMLMEILPNGAVMEHMGERFILPIGNQ